MSVNTHIQLIHVKVNDLKESEVFYDTVFNILGLGNKEQAQDRIAFWGPFGIMLYQQNEVQADIDHHYRLGMVQLGIRVGKKEEVDQLFKALKDQNFTFEWEPKSFDYTDNYYSFLAFDPDDNKLEFIFDG